MTEYYSKKHMAACENWRDGAPVDSWIDADGYYCIRYESGKWWHYSDANGPLEWFTTTPLLYPRPEHFVLEQTSIYIYDEKRQKSR